MITFSTTLSAGWQHWLSPADGGKTIDAETRLSTAVDPETNCLHPTTEWLTLPLDNSVLPVHVTCVKLQHMTLPGETTRVWRQAWRHRHRRHVDLNREHRRLRTVFSNTLNRANTSELGLFKHTSPSHGWDQTLEQIQTHVRDWARSVRVWIHRGGGCPSSYLIALFKTLTKHTHANRTQTRPIFFSKQPQ